MKLPTMLVSQINHVEAGAIARQERSYCGLSMRSVARRMKVSASFLSDLERGRRNWNEKIWKAFEKALRK